MEPGHVRAGWLRMLMRVYRRADAELYRELLADMERLAALAQQEDTGRARDSGGASRRPEKTDVR